MDASSTVVRPALSGQQWTIAANGHEAVVVEVGGGLREYRCDGVDLVDSYTTDEVCPGSAGHVLTPWPNRIRDGKYTFEGTQYELAITEPKRNTAIHGLVNWVRWHAVEVGPAAVTLECALVPVPGYPWPLLLRTTWAVGPGGLRATHEATNLAGTPAPFGLAAHPYLLVAGARVDDLVLELPGTTRLLVDGRQLPIGAAKVAGTDYDYTDGRRIGSAVLDLAFGDVLRDDSGCSTVRLRGPAGAGVACWADESFGWWQVFTGDSLDPPRHRRSVAVEPMTCPADAFRSGRDLLVLEPGQTWRGAWGLAPLAG
jgi:aldose 1-epimerase